ncbi:MAG TPA: cytochrome P450 [Chitinophagales bacterium]|nr:cytochrome P450 [Chitinophagales bacterium]
MNATTTNQTNQPPLVQGLPILGNTLNMINAPIDFIVEQYHKLGPVFKINTVNQQIIFIAGHEANQFLSRAANDYLITKEIWGGFGKSIGAEKFLVALDGEEHFKMRKIMMRGFSPRMLTNRIPAVAELTRKMVLKKLKNKGEIKVTSFIQRLVCEQLGILLANKAPGKYYKPLAFYVRTLLNVNIVRMWPRVALYRPKFLIAQERANKFGEKIIYEHLTAPKPEAPDLIDDLLQAVYEEGLELTRPELLLAVIGPFLAGMDTVTNTLATMIYALAKHRDVLKRLQKEVDDLFANGLPEVKDLNNMPIMHATLMETLRRYPVAPMVPRTVGEPFEFAGYRFEKGQTVYMAQGVTHFLPELFPNPYEFDIDRHLPPRNEYRQKGALSPYGLGAHKCLGFQLGELQMMLTMATLIHMVDFKLTPANYELKMQTIPTLGPEAGFKVQLVPRNIHKRFTAK